MNKIPIHTFLVLELYKSMALPWNRNKLKEIWTWPHIFFLNLPGWWAEEADSKILKTWLSKLRIFTMTYVILLISSMFMGIIKGFAERDVIANLFTVFAASPGVIGAYKMLEVVKHQKSLKSVMDNLSGKILNIIKTVVVYVHEDEHIFSKILKKSYLHFINVIMKV